MANNRHNFSARTIDSLAKRVGYLCSNPNCRKTTIGPHAEENKSTSIGVAAHITAASPGGARYNEDITEIERKSISNGIWLCSDCSILIDKNPQEFPVELLIEWKKTTEEAQFKKICGIVKETVEEKRLAVLDVDMINIAKMRLSRGYSAKNIEIYGQDAIYVGSPMIIHWLLKWDYVFVIFNNSNFNAYNVKIESDNNLLDLGSLPKINHLLPLSNIELPGRFNKYEECFSEEADALLKLEIPKEIIGINYQITYTDDTRVTHKLKATITKDGIQTDYIS